MIKYDELVKEFKSNLERLGYSRNSCYMLPSCVDEFLFFTGETDITGIEQEHINKYHGYIQQRPNKRRPGALSEMMVYHHMYALRLFFNFLEQMQMIRANPMSNMAFSRPQYKERKILTVDEINSLFDAAGNHMERAMLSVFYGCGLRRDEAVRLDVRDVHFKNGLMYIREGKGGRRRVVPMTRKVIRLLRKYYLHQRPSNADKEPFFINLAGHRTSGNRFNNMLKQLIKRAVKEGYLSSEILHRQISLHSLRHSIASHLLENGLSLEYVRDFLGHTCLETTQIYTRINKNQLLAL